MSLVQGDNFFGAKIFNLSCWTYLCTHCMNKCVFLSLPCPQIQTYPKFSIKYAGVINLLQIILCTSGTEFLRQRHMKQIFKVQALQMDRLNPDIQFCHLITVGIQTKYLKSQCMNFLINKMRIIVQTQQISYGGYQSAV